TTAITTNGTTGVTAALSGNSVNLQATTLGTTGNYAISQTFTSGFAWSPASNLSGGVNGQDDATHFSISSSTTTEATNLATAINNAANSGLNVTAGTGGTSTVTVTSNTTGALTSSISFAKVSGGNLANFTWTSASANGANGQPSIVGFNNLYVNAGGTGFCP